MAARYAVTYRLVERVKATGNNLRPKAKTEEKKSEGEKMQKSTPGQEDMRSAIPPHQQSHPSVCYVLPTVKLKDSLLEK